jgi:hypothetical protein
MLVVDSNHSILPHKSKGAQSLVVDKYIEIFSQVNHKFSKKMLKKSMNQLRKQNY